MVCILIFRSVVTCVMILYIILYTDHKYGRNCIDILIYSVCLFFKDTVFLQGSLVKKFIHQCCILIYHYLKKV